MMEDSEKKIIGIGAIILSIILFLLLILNMVALLKIDELETHNLQIDKLLCQKYGAELRNNMNDLLTCRTFYNKTILINRIGERIKTGGDLYENNLTD
jgi:hypothetical protein